MWLIDWKCLTYLTPSIRFLRQDVGNAAGQLPSGGKAGRMVHLELPSRQGRAGPGDVGAGGMVLRN